MNRYRSRCGYEAKDLTSLLSWYHDEVARDSADVLNDNDTGAHTGPHTHTYSLS
eukprot:COSAG05_NODE_10738_length_548_cov_5499.933185_1_plen_53_part_10